MADIRQKFSELIFLKAVNRNKIIGSIGVKIDQELCTINKLFVDPEDVRYGVAKALMYRIEEMAGRVKRFELFTGRVNNPALDLYRRWDMRNLIEKNSPLTHWYIYRNKLDYLKWLLALRSV